MLIFDMCFALTTKCVNHKRFDGILAYPMGLLCYLLYTFSDQDCFLLLHSMTHVPQGSEGHWKKLPQIDKFVKRLYLVIWQSSKNRYLGWCISNSSAWGLEHPRASASEMNWGGYFACVLIHIIIGPYLVLCSDTWQSELFNGVAAGSFFQFFRGKNFGFRVRLYGGKKVALLRILLYPIKASQPIRSIECNAISYME